MMHISLCAAEGIENVEEAEVTLPAHQTDDAATHESATSDIVVDETNKVESDALLSAADKHDVGSSAGASHIDRSAMKPSTIIHS